MKYLTRLLFTCLVLIFFSQECFSQNRKKIDSLLLSCKTVKDTSLVNVFNDLSTRYLMLNIDSAMLFAQKALDLSGSPKLNFIKGIVKSDIAMGDVYSEKGDSKSALEYYKKALAKAMILGHQKLTAFCHKKVGTIYFKDGNYPPAVDNYEKALKINESERDTSAIIDDYSVMSNIYNLLGKRDKALELMNTGLKIAKSTNDSANLAFAYDNIAMIYLNKGDTSLALDNMLRSVKIRELRKEKGSLMAGYNNLGVLYQNEGRLAEANKYYYKVLRMSEEMGSKVGVAISNNNLGETSCKLGDYNKAAVYFDKCITLAKELKYNDLLKSGYLGLSKVYTKSKDFQKALETYQLYTNIKDTILNEASSKQMLEVQTKYETEKKELQIASLSKDKEINDSELKQQRIFIYSVCTGLIMLMALTFFIFRGYREKKKINLELEEKNLMIEEKSKDITDSINYAKRIQKAILTSTIYLKKHLPEHFVLYKPKDIVSGDFYWAYETPDKKVIVVVADCTGHGVPGAFMSLIGASKLNEIIVERKVTSPDRILNHLREEVISAMNPEDAEEVSMDGMDVSVCCFDFREMNMQYAGANNPVYLLRESGLSILKADKFPVGKYSGEAFPFSNNIIALEKGDIIYMFSDGYADQFGGAQGKKFKYKQLQELLIKIRNYSMAEQKKNLDISLEEWRGRLEQVDDILIIGIKI